MTKIIVNVTQSKALKIAQDVQDMIGVESIKMHYNTKNNIIGKHK